MMSTPQGSDTSRRAGMTGAVCAWLALACAAVGLLLIVNALRVDFSGSEGFSYQVPAIVLSFAVVMAVVSMRLLPRGNARHGLAVLAVVVACSCLGLPLVSVGLYAMAMSQSP